MTENEPANAIDREAEWCTYQKGYEEGWQDAMRAYRAGSMRGMDPNATASPPGMPTATNLGDAIRDHAGMSLRGRGLDLLGPAEEEKRSGQ